MKRKILGIGLKENDKAIIDQNENWLLITVNSTEEAVEKLVQINFDAVIQRSWLSNTEIAKLRKFLSLQKQDIILISVEDSNDSWMKDVSMFFHELDQNTKATIAINDNFFKTPNFVNIY